MANRNLVLLTGKSASGKTASLRNLRDPKGVLYINCESGKELPFSAPFQSITITDPLKVFELISKCNDSDKYHTIIIDSLTYLMDMFESVYVLTATNTMKAWSDYSQFFKKLMQQYVATSKRNIIFTAHTMDIYNEGDLVTETMVKVKGALMNQGIESYFNNVISCKKLDIARLEGMDSPLFTITEDEAIEEFKYVYQTKLTKDTVNERIRGPIGMWSRTETFIDNDLQGVLDQLKAYYAE